MQRERREINHGLHRFHRLEEKDIRLSIFLANELLRWPPLIFSPWVSVICVIWAIGGYLLLRF